MLSRARPKILETCGLAGWIFRDGREATSGDKDGHSRRVEASASAGDVLSVQCAGRDGRESKFRSTNHLLVLGREDRWARLARAEYPQEG